jgi:hypothetical protein
LATRVLPLLIEVSGQVHPHASIGQYKNENGPHHATQSSRIDLKGLDLNLLIKFSELLAQRRVSRVAERLGMSQPAPLAQGLADPVAQALAMIHSGLNQSEDLSLRQPAPVHDQPERHR